MVAEKRIFFFSGIQEAKDKSRKQGFRKEHKNLRPERERESCGISGSWSFALSENAERVGCFIQTVVSQIWPFFFLFFSLLF